MGDSKPIKNLDPAEALLQTRPPLGAEVIL